MTIANFEFILKCVRQTRANMQGLMKGLSEEQLNTIPPGFRNNLLWNYGHVIVTQQLLCYALSGQKPVVDKERIEAYRKGTVPQDKIDGAEYQALQALSTSALLQFETDFAQGLFQNFKIYPTSYGVELSRIEEAFQFNLAHEALHLGTMMAIKKLV